MTKAKQATTATAQTDNGDRDKIFTVNGGPVRGLGSFHKSLPHDKYGEVDATAFDTLVAATQDPSGAGFANVEPGMSRPPGARVAQLTNPRAGLAKDRLIDDPHSYAMPPAPPVLSDTTAAEMTELYWMSLLRDVPFNAFEGDADVAKAVPDINAAFDKGRDDAGTDPLQLRPGIDVPGSPNAPQPFTAKTLFRLGLPGDDIGPMLSQFFVRPCAFGTQTIDVRQWPYKAGQNYLTSFDDWLAAQSSGNDDNGQAYPGSNEDGPSYYESQPRYISTMRDLARFVNKDALHQAYFNAALLLLSGGAKWTPGNPYGVPGVREAGFGVLGGPHILALVSEVATRALKAVWQQKWQVHLRLRPEAYGGLAHVQEIGAPAGKRGYGLPAWLFATEAAKRIGKSGSYLLPMAFTPGSPTHPAYGAGHATVAGACVTVLKAYFSMDEKDGQGKDVPVPLTRLLERDVPYGAKSPMKAYITGLQDDVWERIALGNYQAGQLTVEGELNKLAQNVAMGRSMGGVHWRTDNARSLVFGEALAARILCDIAADVVEHPKFTFRTFARGAGGQPKTVVVENGKITVDGGPPTSDSEL